MLNLGFLTLPLHQEQWEKTIQISNTFRHQGSRFKVISFALVSYCNGRELVISTAEGCWPAVVVVGGWVGRQEGAPRSGPVIDRSRLHTKRQDKKRFVVLIWISMPLFLRLPSWPHRGYLSEQKRSPWENTSSRTQRRQWMEQRQ